MDGDEFQRQAVEEKGCPGWQVRAGVGDVGLVEEEGDRGVQDYPVVELPFRGIGHLVGLLMDRDVFGVVHRMDVQEFHQPVTETPLTSVPVAPGGFHGILGVTHSSHGQRYGYCGSGSTHSSAPRGYAGYYILSNVSARPG